MFLRAALYLFVTTKSFSLKHPVIVRNSLKSHFFRVQRFVTSRTMSLLQEIPIVVNNTNVVKQRVNDAAVRHGRNGEVRLVAVSKTKSSSDIQMIFEQTGHRHFGENYFQELVEKAKVLPSEINWHFIGHLQSSKATRLIREVPNLYVVETVDSEKLASKLNNACNNSGRDILNVFIQVDTSGEVTKSGVSEDELIPLVDFITQQCPKLALKGLMTIGAPGDFSCFNKLVYQRNVVAQHLGLEEASLELSMGMSGDFEEAIAQGATSVRVGSTIFGDRIYNKNAMSEEANSK